LREEAIAIFTERIARGASEQEIRRELRLPEGLVDRAVLSARRIRSEVGHAGFRPVTLSERPLASQPRGLVVHGPNGFRVEGLTVSEAVELLRGLR
jgi:hypothetical protein